MAKKTTKIAPTTDAVNTTDPGSIVNPATGVTKTPEDLSFSKSGNIAKDLLNDLVSSFYQVQKLRIQLGNKLSAHFYRKLGLEAAKTLIEQQKGEKKAAVDMIDVLKVEYRRIADALSNVETVNERQFRKLSGDERGIFDEYIEFSWMSEYRQMLRSENRVFKDIELCLNKFPIWTDYLSKIKGVGPTIGGVIVALIDIRKAETPASLWAYSGLDTVPFDNQGEADGRGRGRYTQHLVKVTYIDREGNEKVRNSITFNPLLKTKLVGVLADGFIKHRTPYYREEYDNYKQRIIQREDIAEAEAIARGDTIVRSESGTKVEAFANGVLTWKRRAPMHINRMSIRFMMKRFLVSLYKVWRAMEGLPVVEEYGIRKLGLVHHDSGRGRWAQQMRNTPIVTAQESEDTPEEF
jgi:hypothetical protein